MRAREANITFAPGVAKPPRWAYRPVHVVHLPSTADPPQGCQVRTAAPAGFAPAGATPQIEVLAVAAELESSLEAYFRTVVRRSGGHTFKLAPTEAGIPDRLAVMPGGKIYLVELKRDRARISPIQAVWHNRMRSMGVGVAVLAGREAIAKWIVDPDNTAWQNRRKA
jgi:hypothetical protein